ncbi:response regulator transcription factor [Marixanthomonas spongiae]|uniref:DNA-binding response regulator n=1 Tax=Marixanthomonas spongiae TaxID=2174845 RepID=A0A2U0I3D1_9FLAO|nr:response regulator transcription factor [Marixanthomonas spongiae]PVW15616.1 DNA-binding response regulator [Marixanthomonas spongiae]
MKNILLAEDDQDFGTMLKQYLTLNKFNVTWATNGEEAFEAFSKDNFDLCILDVMMPVMDGFTLAKKIIDINPEVPFLFLTARKTKEDKVKGLKLGADDYVVKPFEAEELIFRIKNIIKRTEQQNTLRPETPQEKQLHIGKYTFDTENLTLNINGKTNKITAKEAKLLYFLYRNRNQLIRRDDILSNVWGKTDFFSGRSMDVFISRIRKSLKDDPSIAIESVRGIGLEFNIK